MDIWDTPISSSSSVAERGPSPSARDGTPDQLAALLTEASAVANELRKPLPVVASRSGRSAGDRSILQILDRHGPQSVPQVARIRGTSRQNIQILVNRLEGQGSVEFRANAAHKRSNLVGLTDQGRVELGATARQEGELLESISSQLSGTEMRVAARLLGRLRGLLATGSAGERPAWKRARRAERGPSTQKAAEVTTAPEPERQPAAADESSPDEGEIPVNLL